MKDRLLAVCAANGLSVGDFAAQKLIEYMDLVLEFNEHTNLTAITDPDQFILRHLADSVTVVPEITKYNCRSLADIGSGAGMPGIPLAIALPDLQVVMVDSTRKKVDFIKSAIEKLGLKNASAVWGRAEELAAVRAPMREKYSAAVARAVAAMPVILEYEAPFVLPGGHLFVMKGPGAGSEPDWRKAAKVLGLDLTDRRELTLRSPGSAPEEEISRRIYTFSKPNALSSKYPRRAGKAVKEPIV